MTEDQQGFQKTSRGFNDPVMVSCKIERSLREEIRQVCFEKDVTIQAFFRRSLILMLRKLKGLK